MNKTLKEKVINTTFKGVYKIIEKEYEHHPNEKPYSNSRVQEGYNDYLRISFKNGEINYFRHNFNWITRSDLKIVCEELNEIKKDDFEQEIVPEIKSKFEDLFFKYEDSFLFRYKILLILEFDTYSNEFYFENKERKEDLKSKMAGYIKEITLEGNNLIKDHREYYIFCRNLLDFNLMGYSEKHLIELIEKILQVLSSIKNEKAENDFKYNIIFFLEDWTKNIFLKLKPKEVTEDQLDLYVYKALFQLKYSKYKDDIIYAYEDLKNAMNKYNSQKAKQYLEKGTGILSDELIYYKDEDLECKANNVLAIIKIKIDNEITKSYEKALNFIINLLNKGFPCSYSVEFSSKSKKEFLNIEELVKSSTHRFFRRILDFPELYNKLEIYAKTAMKKFEFYRDIEDEDDEDKRALSGSYAVFGLALYDEKYFPLLEEYYLKLNDKYQLVHQYFIKAFIDRYGVNQKSLPLILKGFLSGQFDIIFGNLAKLVKNEKNKKLLIKELENYSENEKEIILYSIWGEKWKEMIN